MKRTILTVSVCLGFAPGAAFASDWAVNSTLSETVTADTNPFLQTMLAGGALSSYSTINTNAVALTPTSKFTFDGDESYRKYWGPGTAGVQTESINGDVRAHYETVGKDSSDRNYVNGSLTSQSTSFALLGQLGVVTNARGYLQTSHVDGGIDRDLSALDFVSFQAGTTYTSFDPSGGGTPFTDSTATGSWRHRWDAILTLTASSNVETLDFANAQQSKATIYRENAGFEATLSPLLSFRGSWGAAFVQTENGSAATSLGTSGTGTGSGSATGFLTDMLLTYKMFPDTTVTLAGSQTISPSLVGSLFELSTLQGGLSYTVNPRENVSFSASASRSISAGSETDFVSASAVYGYQLTREWNTQLSYRYLHRFAITGASSVSFDPVTGVPIFTGLGVADSHSITVVLSRNLSILPGS